MKLPSSPSLLRRGRRMTPTAILGAILLVATGTRETAVFAQSDCGTQTSCTECLEADSCDWYNGPGCMDNAIMIADITRYSIGRDSSVEEVCQRASNDQADSRLCSSKTDCSSCVESVLSDSVSTCQWFEDLGICMTGCGMMGCGVTTCRDDCSAKTSCNDCLAASSCDWYNGPGCLDNSVQIADITRYSIDDGDSSVEEVCQRASNNQADSRLCGSKTDCSSCVESVLSDSVNTCQWVEDFGICQTECGMAGCGVTTCRDASAAEGRSPCSAKTSCEECVGATDTDSLCAWVPALFYESYPCTEMSCNLVADPKCYSMESSLDSGTTRTASEICESPVEGVPDAVDPLPGSSAAPCDIFAMPLFLVVLVFTAL